MLNKSVIQSSPRIFRRHAGKKRGIEGESEREEYKTKNLHAFVQGRNEKIHYYFVIYNFIKQKILHVWFIISKTVRAKFLFSYRQYTKEIYSAAPEIERNYRAILFKF